MIPAVFAVFLVLGAAGFVFAASSVGLGTAGTFAVLAGSTITNTGPSVINGDLGLSPGTSVTGFPPGVVAGAQHIADASALQAQGDLVTAYNNAAGQLPVSQVSTELGGTQKTAGIYDSADGTFGITGTLTLDAAGDPDAVFIFKSASTLITAANSNVNLINGAQACNVFWQVGSSATLGTNSTLKGNILAMTSITLTTGARVDGRVLARSGAITLDTNTVTPIPCAAFVSSPPVVTVSATTTLSITTSTPTFVATEVATTTTTPVPAPVPTPAPVVPPTPIFASPLGVALAVPTIPNTGGAGNAPEIILALILSATLVLVGIIYVRRVRFAQ